MLVIVFTSICRSSLSRSFAIPSSFNGFRYIERIDRTAEEEDLQNENYDEK